MRHTIVQKCKYIGIVIGAILLVVITHTSINAFKTLRNTAQSSDQATEKAGEKDEIFSTNTNGLPDIVPTEMVVLKDGDIYEMTAELVKQRVGNQTIKRLAYNRMIPGPLIVVQKDSVITLRLRNEIDVETTLHAHGLRGQDIYDGVPTFLGGRQVAMKPGETFDYQLEFHDAGVFWYHPHIRDDYGQELGLYGNFHVTEENYWNKANHEEFIILDDFQTNRLFYKNKTTQTLMGSYGDVLLINNRIDYNLNVKEGEVVRFYMTNVANTRTFDIAIPGAEMRLVGGDTGRIEREHYIDSIVISPSERWIFEVQFMKPGMYNIDHRGTTIGTITVSEMRVKDVDGERPLRTNAADYAMLRDSMQELLEKKPDKRLVTDIAISGMKDGTTMNQPEKKVSDPQEDEGIEWEDEKKVMNRSSDESNVRWILRDIDSGKENENINWVFKHNDLVKIEIYNDPKSTHPMQHPIHFHGQRLAVISRNGKPVENLQWEDTVLVRTGETVELILHTTNIGAWVAHCHIAEHLEAKMILRFTVE